MKNKKIFLLGSLIALIIILFVICTPRIINIILEETYSKYWISQTLVEAKANRVFTKTVEVKPKSFEIDGKTIEFKDAWIEEQTQIKHWFLFFKTRKYLGNYNLCLKLKNPYSDNIWRDYIFVQEDSGAGFACQAGSNSYVFSENITDINNRTIKVSVIKSWKDKREKNIKFIIK